MGRRFAAAGVLAAALAAVTACANSSDIPSQLLGSPGGTAAAATTSGAPSPGPSTAPSPSPLPGTSSAPTSPTVIGSAGTGPARTGPASTGTAATGPAGSSSGTTTELSTPTAAAQHLFAAWQAGDAVTAATGASHTAVTDLFAKQWTADTYFFGGCSTERECDYNFATGVVRMTVAPDGMGGYVVTDVVFSTTG